MAKRELPKEFFANSGGEVFRDRDECEISFGTGEVTRYVHAPEGSVVLSAEVARSTAEHIEDLRSKVPSKGFVVLSAEDLWHELRNVSGRNYCDICQEYDHDCGCGMVDKAQHINNRRAEEAFIRLTSEPGTDP